MSLNKLIQQAVEAAGSQKALAELIGVTQGNISDFKRGTRPCSMKKRAQMASIAGKNVTRALIEGAIEGLNDDVQHEAEAKQGLLAILSAFPPETDEQPHFNDVICG
jgi:DNA-binding transcriptional regulator YdaS (Cro superfamily)